MDSPRLLEAEWSRSDVLSKMDALYDAVVGSMGRAISTTPWSAWRCLIRCARA